MRWQFGSKNHKEFLSIKFRVEEKIQKCVVGFIHNGMKIKDQRKSK